MFGECHAHMIMDGVNYKKAVAQHKDGVVDAVIRQRFEEYTKRGIFFIRDGGDACGVSKRAAQLACEYGITYRTPVFALHKRGITVASSACLFRTFQSTGTGLRRCGRRAGILSSSCSPAFSTSPEAVR